MIGRELAMKEKNAGAFADKTARMEKLLNILRILSIAIMIVTIIIGALYCRNLKVEDILNYQPQNKILAALFLLFLFALKSMTLFFPLPILYAASGLIFPFPIALLVNSLGIAVCVSVPYWIGRFAGEPMVKKIIVKYPKAKRIDEIKTENQWIFAYLLKTLGFIPNDISSLLMGSMGIGYFSSISASVISLFAFMTACTILGNKMTENIFDPQVIIAFIIVAVIAVATVLIYALYRKHKKKKA